MPFDKVEQQVDFPAQERAVLKFWQDSGAFEALVKKNQAGPRWSFLDGPITANNPMGVHHAWGRTYKDAFQRYHAMLGERQRYQNGFDCQGLWVEVEVEKELGFKSKQDIEAYGVDRFVEYCKERTFRFAGIQTEQSKRLGYFMDWDNSYYTMSDENNYTIWHFLKACHEQGLIYKGDDSMPWCPRCGTGLSEMEVNEGYVERTHRSVYLLFPLTGQYAHDVAGPVFASLREKGLFYREHDYTHRYPTCWRCKTDLVFRVVDEWFINVDPLRERLMAIT